MNYSLHSLAGTLGDRADPLRVERDRRRVPCDSLRPPRRARRAGPGGEVPAGGDLHLGHERRLLLGGRQAAPGRAGDRRGRGRLGRRGRQGGE